MHNIALFMAGSLGLVVAVYHGIAVKRQIVEPLLQVSAGNMKVSESSRRLMPLLMQFSTLCWFVAGIALIAAPIWLDASERFATGLVAGALYATGAIGNFWGSRGRHFGWAILGLVVCLIVYGA